MVFRSLLRQFGATIISSGSLLFISNIGYSLPISKILKADLNLIEKFKLDDIEQPASFNNNYDFEGIVKLNNCSGALIRFENSKPTDKGIVLSNGHCVPAGTFGGFIKPGEFYENKSVSRGFRFLNSDSTLGNDTVYSSKLLYATMTGTDISLYELDDTYAQIETNSSVRALTLDSKAPSVSTTIDILSGYWQKGYSCSIDRTVYELHEEGYIWKDSVRYSQPGCQTIHGTSGSPIIDSVTRKIVGINNTGNDNGEKCTMDNPCEVSKDGTVFFEKGKSYGQQTFQIYSCLDANGQFNLKTKGCQLLGGSL